MFGTELAQGPRSPSPLVGECGMGEIVGIEVTLFFTPTLALPRREGGDLVGRANEIGAE